MTSKLLNSSSTHSFVRKAARLYRIARRVSMPAPFMIDIMTKVPPIEMSNQERAEKLKRVTFPEDTLRENIKNAVSKSEHRWVLQSPVVLYEDQFDYRKEWIEKAIDKALEIEANENLSREESTKLAIKWLFNELDQVKTKQDNEEELKRLFDLIQEDEGSYLKAEGQTLDFSFDQHKVVQDTIVEAELQGRLPKIIGSHGTHTKRTIRGNLAFNKI
ncbi:hypothetical protein O9G_003108 [Rozella allomycis CSF55]|uniref:Uncharacterized protein n=1 Tax=Rozella allomycis (strain CSF55) TaxID=988480 RepID=A0A075AWQ3_ROZAC|nr:hypothetical protein O9G_003108 [Rozella allomycis CSF55]|eukprot:EPZ33112.1 hypothetical protein O9G_003108 [Rozella allomycis CSF55]